MSGENSENREKREHEISVRGRRELRICGVISVDSFDEKGALLQTSEGELTLEGEELKVGVLDTDSGIVTLTGRIYGVFYTDDRIVDKKGIISRIFG